MSDGNKTYPNLQGNQKYSWNDKKCVDISSRDFFPSHVSDTNIQKEIIMQFMNFYLSGKVRKGMTICDAIFAVISIMPEKESTGGMEENFIWPSIEYKDDGTVFFTSPEDKLSADFKNIKLTNDCKNMNTEVQEPSPAGDISGSQHAEDVQNPGPSRGEQNNEVQLTPECDDGHTEDVEELMANRGAEKTLLNKHENSCGAQSTKFNDGHSEDVKDIPSARDTSKDKLPSDIKWVRSAKREPKIIFYGPKENAAFTHHYNKLLEQWQESEQARIQLKSMLGYVALTMMRCTAKSPKHLMNTFSSERFVATMRDLIQWEGPFSIPHKKCVSKSHRVLSRKGDSIPIMFAKIVFWATSKHSSEGAYTYSSRNKIFTVTVLSHTSNYGMGIFNMLQSLACNSVDANALYQVTSCDATKDSWDNLKEFMYQYMIKSSNSSNHVTYPWARILDNNAFKLLGCLNNLALSVIFAVFTEKTLDNDKVWDAAWVAKNSEKLLDYYKALGENMYETYKLRCDASMPREF